MEGLVYDLRRRLLTFGKFVGFTQEKIAGMQHTLKSIIFCLEYENPISSPQIT